MIIDIIRTLLGLVLIITGGLKLLDLRGFAQIAEQFAVLSYALTRKIAYVIPFVEIILGFSLLFRYHLFYASIASAVFFAGLCIILTKALFEKKKLKNCGCLGMRFKIPLSWHEVGRDFVFCVASLLISQMGSYP